MCAIIKSDVKIGTIFSYVTTADGFKEEIVLEKHKVTGNVEQNGYALHEHRT